MYDGFNDVSLFLAWILAPLCSLKEKLRCRSLTVKRCVHSGFLQNKVQGLEMTGFDLSYFTPHAICLLKIPTTHVFLGMLRCLLHTFAPVVFHSA